jgi:hypothetical protein
MKSRNGNKIKWIHLRISAAEHKLLLHYQKKTLCRNLSQYVRDVIFKYPLVQTYRNRSQDDLVKQMTVLNNELNAVGNNLNQITKRLHTLRASEMQPWGIEFTSQAGLLTSKIAEIKEVTAKIAERWLR